MDQDFDLNLLKVFVTVAEAGSVTLAASRLYVTQPAVSASLRRLATVVGSELFIRQGRGLRLTGRGQELFVNARVHIDALVSATVQGPAFDPITSRAVIRFGIADGSGSLVLPHLQRLVHERAPNMQLVLIGVQFRTIESALLDGHVMAALSVADPLPKSIMREVVARGGFRCVYDSRFVHLPRSMTEDAYFAHEHVIVSYAGDLRGIVEDTHLRARKIRISLPSFVYVGEAVEGSDLIATVPELYAHQLVRERPHLRTAPLPFELETFTTDLLWSRATDEDPTARFFRSLVRESVTMMTGAAAKSPRRSRARARPKPAGR